MAPTTKVRVQINAGGVTFGSLSENRRQGRARSVVELRRR